MEFGQGTIEYLLIMAIVIVIGLFVAGFSSLNLTSAQQIDSATSKTYWNTQTVSIIDSVADSTGDGKIVFKNNESEQFTIETITIDGVRHDVNYKIFPQNVYALDLNGLLPCTDSPKSYSITIVTLTVNGIQKTLIGQVPLLINCIADVTITGSFTGDAQIPLDTDNSDGNVTQNGSTYLLLDTNLYNPFNSSQITDGNTDTNTTINGITVTLEEA